MTETGTVPRRIGREYAEEYFTTTTFEVMGVLVEALDGCRDAGGGGRET